MSEPIRILVADRNRHVRELLRRELAAEGYLVQVAKDGQEVELALNGREPPPSHGQQIFHMSASFQIEETGPDHQAPAPEVAQPEQLPDLAAEMRQRLHDLPAERRRFWSLERPFEIRSVESIRAGEPHPGVRHVWFRLLDEAPADPTMQRCLLAYMSDYHLLETATLPHGLSHPAGDVTLASIDHGMWFHRPVRLSEWHLYALVSPSSSGSRGLAFGRIFDRQGRLIASTAQEGLIRVRTPKTR